jgi:hypothetical protein
VVIDLPAASLSSRIAWKPNAPVDIVRTAIDPRLAPLLTYLAARNDIPRETSQLIVFALLENISFAAWEKYITAARPAPPAAPISDAAVALDALAILRTIQPVADFALANDGALKLRALRDPLLRPRALQLFGLTAPDDRTTGGVAPDLGQLLHSKPGDNCPVCRVRDEMRRPAEIP